MIKNIRNLCFSKSLISRSKTLFITTIITGFLFLSPIANAKTKIVVDASGKEVVIPANPKRIAIASDREFTDTLIAAGIIPIAVASQHEFAPYLKKEVAKIKNLIDLGSHKELDLEILASAKPDLIVMRSITGWGGNPELYKSAIKIAPVVQLSASNGLRNLINEIGGIWGKEVSNNLHKRVDNAVAKMRNTVKDSTKIIISHGSAHTGEIGIYRENSNLASQLIKEAGYSRPEIQKARVKGIDNNLEHFSFENINYLDGDVLFLNVFKRTDADVKKMLNSSIWKSLNVVKKGRVIPTNFRYWNYGGALAAEAIAEDFVQGLKKAGLAKVIKN